MLDPSTMTQYLTVGRFRKDGDLDVFATLNNSTFGIAPEAFARLANELRSAIGGVTLVRQDAPDVVSPEGATEVDPTADLRGPQQLD